MREFTEELKAKAKGRVKRFLETGKEQTRVYTGGTTGLRYRVGPRFNCVPVKVDRLGRVRFLEQ